MSMFTQNYQLEFLAPGEPVKNTRVVLERMTKSIDAALTRGGLAPQTVQDAISVIGRVTTLETGRPSAPSTIPIPGAVPVGAYPVGYYYRDRAGLVHLGSIATVPTTGLAANTALFTLPTGFRPAVLLPLMLQTDSIGNTGTTGPRVQRFDLRTDGALISPTAISNNSGYYVWLDNIVFPAP